MCLLNEHAFSKHELIWSCQGSMFPEKQKMSVFGVFETNETMTMPAIAVK